MAPEGRRARLLAPVPAWLFAIITMIAPATVLLPRVDAQTTSSVSQEALADCPTEAVACQDDADCVLCSSGVVPETQGRFEECLASVSTEDICTAYGITLCCMDALAPGVSCLANEAFLGYYTCVIAGATGVVCSGWSCAEIGVTLPDSSNSTTSMEDDFGGSGELSGVTADSATPAPAPGSELSTTETSAECPQETDACQSDPVCVECSGVVTEETQQEWDSCISSVATQDLCVGYGVVLCCMTELSANNCMVNAPFIDYYQCVIRTSTGQECPDWSCSEIGASIGVVEEEEHEAGSGELTGITSLSTSPAPVFEGVEATGDSSAAAAVVAVGPERRWASASAVVAATAGAVGAGYVALAALG